MRTHVFSLLVVLGLVAAMRGRAEAQVTKVNSDVIVLHGTNDGSGIDPKIGKAPELGKPPHSSYDSYKLLDRSKVAMEKSTGSTIKLPNDGVLMLKLKDVIEPKKKADPRRYVIVASIQKPGATRFLPLVEVEVKAGERFYVAGQNYKGGVLSVGVTVVP